MTAFLPPGTACSCYLYPVVSCFLDVAKQRDKVNSNPELLKVREETNRKLLTYALVNVCAFKYIPEETQGAQGWGVCGAV